MDKLNFAAEYFERSDDELLQLASDRSSLANEAAAAVDDELRRRNLTESDRTEHQQFVRRKERREALQQRRKIFGRRSDRSKWVDLFWALLAMALISFTYFALPSRYPLKPDWQESAVIVMFASVFIAIPGGLLWRKAAFWTSLFISSGIHLVVVHSWIRSVGSLNHNRGELAILLGFILFIAVYAFVWRLQRSLYGEEAIEDR